MAPRSHIASKSVNHHCPGASVWIGDIPPGNCDHGYIQIPGRAIKSCKKHNMACPGGCQRVCLKNQQGCTSCINKWEREAAQARKQKEQDRKDAEKNPWKEWYDSGSNRSPNVVIMFCKVP
ncbi:hypothetical protein DM02DRAFT_672174 [Periconia macrospinosa]|uniref:Uncharacterized protein n=1 Tax=Periconia macrospinosa TaxID=97972 RepID=A0A2V1DQE9_9PLEO|nr:hypothetical protein DM02DRAFT_672174 [Periconia macrospinosa]